MNEDQIIEMLKELLQEIDYDHYKCTFVPHLIEDEETNEEHVERLVEIVQKHLGNLETRK